MKIWACAARAATAFCCRPPISPTLPSGSIVPVTATRLPPVRSPGRQRVDDRERHRQAGRRAADVARVDVDVHRDLVAQREVDTDDGGSRALRRPARARSAACRRGRCASATVDPGLMAPSRSSTGRRVASASCPSAATISSHGCSTLYAGSSCCTVVPPDRRTRTWAGARRCRARAAPAPCSRARAAPRPAPRPATATCRTRLAGRPAAASVPPVTSACFTRSMSGSSFACSQLQRLMCARSRTNSSITSPRSRVRLGAAARHAALEVERAARRERVVRHPDHGCRRHVTAIEHDRDPARATWPTAG